MAELAQAPLVFNSNYFLTSIYIECSKFQIYIVMPLKEIELLSSAQLTDILLPLAGGPKAYHLYALTISSNYATSKTAYKSYQYVINQLPSSTFTWIREISKHGKHHIHGILKLKYKFDYLRLKSSLQTEVPFSYDMHLHYDALKTHTSIKKWTNYMYSELPKVLYTQDINMETSPWVKIPKTCIPEVKLRVQYKNIKINGL